MLKCRMDKQRCSNTSVQTKAHVTSSKVPEPKSKPNTKKGKKLQQDHDGPTKGSRSHGRKGKEREIMSSPEPGKILFHDGWSMVTERMHRRALADPGSPVDIDALTNAEVYDMALDAIDDDPFHDICVNSLAGIDVYIELLKSRMEVNQQEMMQLLREHRVLKQSYGEALAAREKMARIENITDSSDSAMSL
jgi:hypothetical protein